MADFEAIKTQLESVNPVPGSLTDADYVTIIDDALRKINSAVGGIVVEGPYDMLKAKYGERLQLLRMKEYDSLVPRIDMDSESYYQPDPISAESIVYDPSGWAVCIVPATLENIELDPLLYEVFIDLSRAAMYDVLSSRFYVSKMLPGIEVDPEDFRSWSESYRERANRKLEERYFCKVT